MGPPQLSKLGHDGIAVVHGDRTRFLIAAASIIAKVTRDRIMAKLDKKYPEYKFKSHKGYGTAAHAAALKRHGVSPVHRRSYEPIKVCLEKSKRRLILRNRRAK